MSRILRIALPILACTLALAPAALAKGKDFDGQQAPDFQIEEMSFGSEASLGDFDGKLVLLEFWFLG